ncbi:Uncharacterised protein [Shigella sonnei]|nr:MULTISPECIES: hypothetical protein [Enterobacteriaceae]SRP93514.1 Uncharacterised protein [Shigella sonnei]SRQ18406.1 Uncharacterised protein [Shigella sonnei]SRQ30029.1 Uncharacterised protein [Shigella sonnei]SRQ98597.1 Uncharacterised protein [Shigella sonnei]SRS04902.1 Uncharacterised protein [Shigella sonnei]
MFFLYETYNFFYYLIKLIVIQPQYICVYMIFFFFNAGIAYSITNDIEDQVCRWLLFVSMLHALMIPPAVIMPPKEILQETEKRQELHESIPKTCKLKALDAQQGGLFGVDKDEWVFPDNKSFYLPEKYRPENRITELAMMKEG